MTPDELRASRHQLGLTQEAFAEKIGAKVSSVRQWEIGRYKVPGPVAVLVRMLLDGKGKK